MNLIKRAAAWVLTLLMVSGLIPQMVFAEEPTDSPLQTSSLQYEVLQEVNEDKTESVISLKFTENETIQLEKVTLPDGTEKVEDLSVVTYTVYENGTYDFKVNYSMDGTEQEETASIEVTGLEKAEDLTSVETTSNLLQGNGNTYEVSSDDKLAAALEQIGNSQETEATVVLTADIGYTTEFIGVPDKTVTVKSAGEQKYELTLGSELVGDITLDNVKASAGTLYCGGHRTIFTENCEFVISGTLYGGGKGKTVPSVYVKINGTGKINISDMENVVVGGSYKGSVEGDIYVELAGNIRYGDEQGGHYLVGTNKATAYGGDKPGSDQLYVGGDVTLILDGPATDTKPQNIVGAYNSHVKGNVTVQVKAGYATGIEGMREDPNQSIVDGDIHIIAGDPAYAGTDRIVRIGANWDIIGAGEKINLTGNLFQVGGNVTVDTYENVWGWDKDGTPDSDPPGIVGAESATVGGNVTINANGSHLEDIIGVDDSATTGSTVNGDIVINATNVDLRNSYNDQSGIIPVYATAGKDVTVNLDGGSLSGIYGYGGTVVGNMEINITGQPVFTDDEAGVWGVNNTDTKERSVLNFDKAKTSIPTVGYFTEMNVTNDSDVTLGNEKKNAFTIFDVNINTNAKLTTNQQAYSKGALTMDHGTWIANGYLYVTTTTNTNNSEIVMNDYAAFGYGYKDNSAYDKTVVTSIDDTYTFNQCNYVDKIYGNAEITNSTWNVFVPTMIGGDYKATSNKLNLLAFVEKENYPDEKIPLEILGTTTGKTAVTLVDKADTSKEGKPIVGQNYINALKVSEDSFELVNKNAEPDGLYFKKLADANTQDKTDYDMWQVTKRNESDINQIPIINANDKTIAVGDEFDPLKDVTATDKEDGDIPLTMDNVMKNEVDTTKAGVYEVTYKVTDSQGASSIKTIKVTVTEKDTSVVPGESNKPTKPDTDKPSGSGSVETGDKANPVFWGIILILSGISVYGIYAYRRRKANS